MIIFLQTREEAKSMLRKIHSQRGQDEGQGQGVGLGVSVMHDDSMESVGPGEPRLGGPTQRAFGRVTPVNLKFTP